MARGREEKGKRVRGRGGWRVESARGILFSLEALAVLLQTVRLLAATPPCVHARLLHNLVDNLWRKRVDVAALDRLVQDIGFRVERLLIA